MQGKFSQMFGQGKEEVQCLTKRSFTHKFRVKKESLEGELAVVKKKEEEANACGTKLKEYIWRLNTHVAVEREEREN